MTFPADSTVDVACAALVTALEAVVDAETFVHDGPVLQWPKTDAIVIGVGNPAVEQTLEVRRMGGDIYRESYTVHNTCYSWGTSGTIADRRARAKALLVLVRGVVDAIAAPGGSLHGVVMRAQFGSRLLWVPTFDADGPAYEVGFDLSFDAEV